MGIARFESEHTLLVYLASSLLPYMGNVVSLLMLIYPGLGYCPSTGIARSRQNAHTHQNVLYHTMELFHAGSF